MIDTHREVEILIAAGFEKEKAEAVVRFYMSRNEDAATKIDIVGLQHKVESLESKLEAKISRVESKIDNLETKLNGDIRSLGTDIKWIMAVLLAITGMLTKLTFFNGS